MKEAFSEYKKLFKDKKYKKSLQGVIPFALLAGIMNYFVYDYLKTMQGNYVGDLFLDYLPTLGLFWFRSFGIVILVVSIFVLIFYKPRYIPFGFKTAGLMYIIRPFFVTLTHLTAYPTKMFIPETYPLLGRIVIYQTNDLFFSGHVALPFLVSLIFWDNKKIRYSFIFIAVICGIAALLAKTHYSIDVFAAPFITYSIYKIAEKIFKKDFDYIKKKNKK